MYIQCTYKIRKRVARNVVWAILFIFLKMVLLIKINSLNNIKTYMYYHFYYYIDNFSYHKKTVVFDVFLLYNIYRGVTYENDKSK